MSICTKENSHRTQTYLRWYSLLVVAVTALRNDRMCEISTTPKMAPLHCLPSESFVLVRFRDTELGYADLNASLTGTESLKASVLIGGLES